MDTVSYIALIFGLVLTIVNIIERLIIFVKHAKGPHIQHENRILALESEVKEIKETISSEDERVIELEEGTKVLMKSISALLSHGIDGNNTDEMKEAKKELNAFLIAK